MFKPCKHCGGIRRRWGNGTPAPTTCTNPHCPTNRGAAKAWSEISTRLKALIPRK